VAVEDVLSGVVNGDDVAVIQGRRRLCFPAEPGLEGGVGRMIDSQHLDGDDPAQPPVAAPANLCHPAPAEHLAEFVAISEESLIGHWSTLFSAGAERVLVVGTRREPG
jgi:hypothetical protein